MDSSRRWTGESENRFFTAPQYMTLLALLHVRSAIFSPELSRKINDSGWCPLPGGKDPAAPLVGESATGRSAALREGSDRPAVKNAAGQCFVISIDYCTYYILNTLHNHITIHIMIQFGQIDTMVIGLFISNQARDAKYGVPAVWPLVAVVLRYW